MELSINYWWGRYQAELLVEGELITGRGDTWLGAINACLRALQAWREGELEHGESNKK